MRFWLLLLAAGLSAQPLVLGHRGFCARWPENTIPGYERALEAGADMLEIDVVVTKDNELVVHHDFDIKGKPVRSMTLAEVLTFDRGSTPSPGFPRQTHMPGTRIPTLDQTLAFAKKRNARLIIETKVDPNVNPEWFAAEIDKKVRRFGLSTTVHLESANHRTLHEMRKLNPEVGLILLNPPRRLPDYVSPAKALGPKAIQFVNFRVINAEIMSELRAAGIKIFSGTTDDPAEWAKLIQLGVDAILTDDPESLRQKLRR